MDAYLEDPKRQWWLIASVAFAAFVSALDGNIVSIALPDLARDLQVPVTSTSQVMVAYILFMSASLPLVGKLGALFGAKRLFLGGFALFGIGSLICGVSRTLEILIAARVFQSMGAAALLATGYVLVAEHLPPSRRGTAMGLLGASASIASVVGPPIGGFMTQALGWSSIFLVNVPFCVIAFFFGWHYLPHDLPASEAEKSAPFDWVGLLFITLALVGVNHGLNRIDLEGWTSHEGLLFFCGGLIFTGLFVWQERRATAPIIPGAVFGDFRVILAMVSVITVMMILGCLTILGPFFLQRVHELPPSQVGLVMTVPGLIMLIAAPVSGMIADRLGAERLSTLAAVLITISCVLMAMLGPTSSIPQITVVFSLLGLSVGLFFPPNSTYVMSLASRELRSITASTYNVLKNIGMLLGISVLGSLAYTVAKSHFAHLTGTPDVSREALAIGFSAAMSGAVGLAVISAIASALTCLPHAKPGPATTTPAP